MVEAMFENSAEYFKKTQKRFKHNICETEPKLENTTIENYTYGYHSSATVIEVCSFGSNHYHVMYEFGSQDDKMFDSLYVPAMIPCLVNCFKLLIQPMQEDFVKRGAIILRLHFAVEYLSKSTSSVTKNQKQLPAPLIDATAKSISSFAANKRSSTVSDVTMKQFCQLMLGEHSPALYQIILSGQGSFVREASNSFITFQFCKNWYSKSVVVWKLFYFYIICFTKASNSNSFTTDINWNFSL